MKRVIRASRGTAYSEYRGYTIYENSDKYGFHIFLGKNGTDRVDFPTEEEAVEYIDDIG